MLSLLLTDPTYEITQSQSLQIDSSSAQDSEVHDMNLGSHLDQNEVLICQCQSTQDLKMSLSANSQSAENFRGTQLRGVSKNGRFNWQILSMRHGQKYYLGTVDNIIKAAILYDIFSIQIKGLKAKTNFSYTRRELRAIVQLQSLVGIKHAIIKSKKGIKTLY
jgi:hypothetical protein